MTVRSGLRSIAGQAALPSVNRGWFGVAGVGPRIRYAAGAVLPAAQRLKKGSARVLAGQHNVWP